MTPTIETGMRVKFAQDFLRNIAAEATNPMWRAEGSVVSVATLGGGTIIAEVDWSGADVPTRVNVANLRPLHYLEAMP